MAAGDPGVATARRAPSEGEARAEARAASTVARPAVASGRARPVHAATIAVLLVVIAFGTGLSLSARAVHNTNEQRLLRQRVREAGTVLTTALPTIQTPLASAAEVAAATGASAASFTQVIGQLVGSGRPFASAAIWPVDAAGTPRPLVVIGTRPVIETSSPQAIRALLARPTATRQLTVVGLLSSAQPRLAYAYSSFGAPVRYVVYAEAPLPANRTAVIQKSSAFADLGYALYLGSSQRSQDLLAASTSHLPLRGRTSAVTVPFGDNSFRLVMTPTAELGGALLGRLPWLLFASGLLLAIAAAGLTERLVRRREQAQRLADENSRLYAAQRTVAQTLQHSLLPETLPDIPGLMLGVRYLPGVSGVEIGGDWYDAIPVAEGRLLVIVGDVSGRGLRAATIMASLRYAIRAYAAQGDGPATILAKLAGLLSVETDGHFATVLCALIDIDGHEITIANAGHPEPLLVDGEAAAFVSTKIGAPVGVRNPVPYEAVTISVPKAATLLGFTDGLVERRGEHLDVGLGRLRDAAARAHGSVEELLTQLVAELSTPGSRDDTAIVGVRWTN